MNIAQEITTLTKTNAKNAGDAFLLLNWLLVTYGPEAN